MSLTRSPDQATPQPDEERPDPPPIGTRERLAPPMPGSVLWGWLGPLIVTAFGAVLRFQQLGLPKALMFDETYYAKDAFSLVTHGVEREFFPDANEGLLAGITDIFMTCVKPEDCATLTSHPPLGKWLIGLGELAFGVTPYGWRFAAAVFGTLSILVLARVARRMTRSTLLGCLAGFLLALDGLHFVLSRSALLDIFLMFWVLAGFACLVVDRDRTRERLAAWHDRTREAGDDLPDGARQAAPRLGPRPWRLAAGVCLGAALATKWSAVYFIPAFAIMSLLWDAGARKAVGLPRPFVGTLRRDTPLAAAWMAVVPLIVYAASYATWFASADGAGRNWARATSGGPVHFVVDSLKSWIANHKAVLAEHTALSVDHSSMSWPWGWPFLVRPVWFHGNTELPPGACDAAKCVSDVRAVGTPVIWYAGLAALVALIAWYTATRDWRAGSVLLGYAAGWLPWFYFAIADDRTMYIFYMLPVLPFMILAIALALGLLIGPVGASPARRAAGAAVTGAFLLLTLVNFWWLHPILTGEIIPAAELQRRLWDVWQAG